MECVASYTFSVIDVTSRFIVGASTDREVV